MEIIPIDTATPTLYDSSCEERIVKVFQVASDTSTIYTYGYYDESANFPGAVSTVLIELSQYLRDDSYKNFPKSDSFHTAYEITVTSIKKCSVLPSKMFDIDQSEKFLLAKKRERENQRFSFLIFKEKFLPMRP